MDLCAQARFWRNAHGVFTYAVLAGLSDADANKDGVVDVAELGRYVKTAVPALTGQPWGMVQVPQVSLAGAQFRLAPRTSEPLVAALNTNRPIPVASSTYTLAGPAMVRQAGNGAAMEVAELPAGTRVSVVQTRGDCQLIARDGKVIGYVEAKNLKAAEGR
jgi:hypothetical protein